MIKKYFLIKVVFIIFICLNCSFLIAQKKQTCPNSCDDFFKKPKQYSREKAKECIVRYIECTWDFKVATTTYIHQFKKWYGGDDRSTEKDIRQDIKYIQSLIRNIQSSDIYRNFQILKSSITSLTNEIEKMRKESVELRKKIINLQTLSEKERDKNRKLEMDINDMIGKLFSSYSDVRSNANLLDSQKRTIDFNYGKRQVELEFERILNTLKDLQSLSTTTATNEQKQQILFMINTLNDKFRDLKDKWVRISSSNIGNVVFSTSEKSNINDLVNQIDVLISTITISTTSGPNTIIWITPNTFTSGSNNTESTQISSSEKEKNPTTYGGKNVSKKIATLILVAMVFLLSFLLIKIVINKEGKFLSQNKNLKNEVNREMRR